MSTSFFIQTPDFEVSGYTDGYPTWIFQALIDFNKQESSFKDQYLKSFSDQTRNEVSERTTESKTESILSDDESTNADWTYLIDENKRITLHCLETSFFGNYMNANPFFSTEGIIPEYKEEEVNKLKAQIETLRGMGYTFAFEDPKLVASYDSVIGGVHNGDYHESKLSLITKKSVDYAKANDLQFIEDNLEVEAFKANYNEETHYVGAWSKSLGYYQILVRSAEEVQSRKPSTNHKSVELNQIEVGKRFYDWQVAANVVVIDLNGSGRHPKCQIEDSEIPPYFAQPDALEEPRD
ncbi:hypothetical protein DZF79_15725 [Vibrio parahaemolyticus]|nr:hypothetical protein [Vibrio parahaemolyticus]